MMFSFTRIHPALNLNIARNCDSISVIKRFKRKIQWYDYQRIKFPHQKALVHFDDFYKTIFRLKWPSVRLALLAPHKYVAVLNNLGDVEETETMLQNLGALNIKVYFDNQSKYLREKKLKAQNEQLIGEMRDKFIEDRFRKEEMNKSNVLYPAGTEEELRGLLFSEEEEDELRGRRKDPEYYSESDDSDEEEEEPPDSQRLINPEVGLEASSIHEFIPATKLKGMEDYITETEYYNYYKVNVDMPIRIEKEYHLEMPEHLKIYSFDRGDISDYPLPTRGKTGVLNYYLMNGASILPVLALGLKPGDTVLDMCAAPGGKSLIAFQTLYPKLLVSNDLTGSRKQRVNKIFTDYLFDCKEDDLQWKDMVMMTRRDGGSIDDANLYDKILVDVPCTNDRLSLEEENDNNIFKPSRVKERLELPILQCGLLANALKIVRVGGTVVYSTCTLSPIQNDGIVHMALRRLWEETRMEFKIINMSPALECTSSLFKYGTGIGLKFGHLVVPFVASNFGPAYFCKIVKISEGSSDLPVNICQ